MQVLRDARDVGSRPRKSRQMEQHEQPPQLSVNRDLINGVLRTR
jgi:hypothetical protein